MSDETFGEVEATARQVMRRFDTDRGGARALFREILARKAFAGKVQQQLNRFGRHDVAAAFIDLVPLDPKTPELVITETARGLAKSDRRVEAEALLARVNDTRRHDYNFQLAAGRVLAEIRQHALALPYFEAAFAARPTEQAAERLFLAHLALQQYGAAADALWRILRAGSYRELLAQDIAFLLRHVAPGKLDGEIAFALVSLPTLDDVVGSALMPHLIAHGMMDSVLAVVERDVTGFANWDEELMLKLVAYLAKHGRIDQVLSIGDRYDGSSAAVAPAIAGLLEAMPVGRRTQFLSPHVEDFMGSAPDGEAYRKIAARFAETADADDALRLLALLPKVVDRAEAGRFFAREKSRLGWLAARAMEKKESRAEAVEALIAIALHVVDPQTAQFFASTEFRELVAATVTAKRQDAAPDGSRTALLRDDYFAFQIERRTGRGPEALVNDIAFCEAVFDYCYDCNHLRSAIAAPIGRALAGRTSRTALELDGGRTLDVLTDWGIVQARPELSLVPPAQYDKFHLWYLDTFLGARNLPTALFNPTIVAHLNEVVIADELTGLPVTRYLKLLAGSDRKAVDLLNVIDRTRFVLNLVATLLSSRAQFLVFFEPLMRSREGMLARMLTALGGQSLLDAVEGKAPVRRAASAGGERRDILLIGHASKETGLGRNFGMLAQGLDRFAVTKLDFEAGADAFTDTLRRWHAGLRSRPIAVLAVNAHDVPDIFVKDRDGLLADSYAVGFFLWEVSHIPPVQRLGVNLVDEIWAPTRYVAAVYAPHKPTYVVGKGLFHGNEPFLARPRAELAGSRFGFVTVFDFDSSIERKNPLAAVLAFQRAFPGNEKVELVIKTSNVNPQHWSNVWHQWEQLSAAAAQDRRVKIITERYSADDMTALVRDADCIVSLHRAEGFGYLLSDAMAYGVPVIATDYSGNADFCTAETSWPVAYRLVDAPAGAVRWRCEGAQWADPDIEAAAAAMRAVFEDRDAALQKARRAQESIKQRYSFDALRTALAARLDAIAAKL